MLQIKGPFKGHNCEKVKVIAQNREIIFSGNLYGKYAYGANGANLIDT